MCVTGKYMLGSLKQGQQILCNRPGDVTRLWLFCSGSFKATVDSAEVEN